uniref:ORF1629 n=1 Tax=Spodoptera frugiperda nuclear polyhedrosis virus TaxID=10455 RepID=E9L5Z4_NPVSF|nr:Sf2 protein [Spodoptera frugiperda multiple nucleopolyhedrovirus]AFH58965.1 ORF1629 [Spodoptera frugiperda multiple nucleopolyhedrovirus]QED40203.1 PP78/83 [Spodoptera frugiperda multiple nucleopolyhedrovirus]QRN46114.1 PP78/82 [Spodoptera frugiperda multiple nucleopolyhedrovirus]
MATMQTTVYEFLQNPQNNVVDLFQKLTKPVSTELFDAVCYRDENMSSYDDEVTLNSRTLMEVLQLAWAIYENKVMVRVDAAPASTSIPVAMSAKITQLKNMVRHVNDSSRFKSKLENILESIVNENNISNLSALLKTFLDLYKLYQIEENDINKLFTEIVTLDQTKPSAETVSSALPNKAPVSTSIPQSTPKMGAEQSYAPPPPPPPPSAPITLDENNDDAILSQPPPSPIKVSTSPPQMDIFAPPPPPMPNLISTPNAPVSVNIPPPPPPPPPPPMMSPPTSEIPLPPPPTSSKIVVQSTKDDKPSPKPVDFQSELRERLKRKTPISEDKLKALQNPPAATKPKSSLPAEAPLMARSESAMSILHRRNVIQPSSTSSGSEIPEEDNDWLASPSEIESLKTQYVLLKKKLEQLPMEPPESITTLMTAINMILAKKQITADDADTLRNYYLKFDKLMVDVMTL